MDDDKDNAYVVTVKFTDAGGKFDTKTVTVTVTDEKAPQFTSASSIAIDENQKSVITVAAIDDEKDPITYSIEAGGDSAAFVIDSKTGVLELNSNADFETKSSYGVTVLPSMVQIRRFKHLLFP